MSGEAAQQVGRGPAAAGGSSWTTRSLLKWIGTALGERGIESPRLCAELLVSHVLGCERLKLYMDADRPASALERDVLRGLVSRALKHEPVQYLVGEGWFFSLPMRVDRRVLIPRPCTEMIVEHVLQHARTNPGLAPGGAWTLADVCTGSGCIAVAILKQLGAARAAATDVSADAIEVASANALRHGVKDRMDLLVGNLLEPLSGHPMGSALHYLVSNPPYIPDWQWESTDPEHAVGANVKGFEPEIALRGGVDGLAFVRPIVERAPALLREGGVLLVEIASATEEAVLELARAQDGLREVRVEKDFEGLPRMLHAVRG